jgi:SPP1 gp7 family putative phage head morphogenesis protein
MARYEGTSELNALNMNNAFYDNGAYPSGVIETDKEINPDTFEKLRIKIKQAYEGRSNAYKMMFLTHGLKYNAITPTQRDMEYVAQRKLNRDQILSIFKVPKSLMAVSDNVNKATAEVEYKAFMATVVKPRLELIFDKINRFMVAPLFGNEYEFQYENPIPDDEQFELDEKVASVNSWRTVNEIRAKENLEPLPGYDVLVAFGGTPTSEDTEDDNPEDNEDEPPEDKPTKHIEKMEQLPNPDAQTSKKAREYTARRNTYISTKEIKYALALRQHFTHLVRDVGKKSIDNPTEDEILAELLPDAEKQRQWKILLYGIIFKNGIEIYKTAQKQLKDVYGLDFMLAETVETIASSRASFTSKTVSDTVFAKVKEVIRDDIAAGKTNLRDIKNDLSDLLSGQKDWKVEQIARTEISWTYGDAQQKIYKANNIEKVKWIAGEGACEICQENAGHVIGVNEAFPSGDIHEPAHINCRCEVVPLVI